jgi:hypothetical protein
MAGRNVGRSQFRPVPWGPWFLDWDALGRQPTVLSVDHTVGETLKRWNMSDHFPHWFARSWRYFRHVQTMFEYNFDQMDQSAMFVCGFETPWSMMIHAWLFRSSLSLSPGPKKNRSILGILMSGSPLQTSTDHKEIARYWGSQRVSMFHYYGCSWLVIFGHTWWYPH